MDRLLPAFIQYCDKTLPSEAVKLIRTKKLFAAGYIRGSPTICYYNEAQLGGQFGCIRDSGFIETAPSLSEGDEGEFLKLSSKEAATLARKAIQRYAGEGSRWKTIGGPISIYVIGPTSSSWIENEPSRQWPYIQDLIKDHQAGRVELHLIPPATKKQLETLLSTVQRPH